MVKKELVIMRAQSGSGKTTYIKNNFPTAFVCSADHYHVDENGVYKWSAENAGRAHIFSKNACQAAMINNLNLIAIDNTNTTPVELRPYIDLAKQYGYNIRIIRLVVPPSLSAARNVHNVPFETVKQQHARICDIPADWAIKEEIINNE